jgi:hypothetical protein
MNTTAASLALAALLVLGCSSTKISEVYVDSDFKGGPFEKLMVIGLGASEGGRVQFENAVSDKLAERGLLGVGSHNVIAASSDVTRDAVRAWAQTDGYDAVLVTRLVDVKKDTTYRPPTYTDFYGYWGSYGSYVTSPGYVLETTTLVIETTLFDVATAKPVYTAVSKSFEPSSRADVIHELVQLLVADLTKRGLLPAPKE